MNSNSPIVDEIRAIRERLAARFGFDVYAIGKDAQEREAQSGRDVVSRPPRGPEGWKGPVPQSAIKE
jgi:hypothetical protein